MIDRLNYLKKKLKGKKVLERLFYKSYRFFRLLTPPCIRKLVRRSSFGIISRKLATLGAKKYPYPKKTVLDYEWDYLIVIDACRHDLFEEVNGETESIISVGSCTDEWFNNTFKNKNYDLIYISGNPVVSKPSQERLGEGKISFFELEPVWDYGWDKELKTTPPEEVTKKALELTEEYPDKKMIIHYIQPHRPFIGEKRVPREKKYGEEGVWEAYKSNLNFVMEEVEKLVENPKGRVVLTSDHGNCVGEFGFRGHFRGNRLEGLVRVPWVVLKDETERGESKVESENF